MKHKAREASRSFPEEEKMVVLLVALEMRGVSDAVDVIVKMIEGGTGKR